MLLFWQLTYSNKQQQTIQWGTSVFRVLILEGFLALATAHEISSLSHGLGSGLCLTQKIHNTTTEILGKPTYPSQ